MTSNQTIALTDRQRQDLDIARRLTESGVPVFVLYPDPSHPGEYLYPPDWQHTQPRASYVDAWRPGMALGAVMGHGLDLADFDLRNGADLHALDGVMPKAYATAATPSGGVHAFVASMNVRSRDALLPGIDIKAGDSNGNGRGFAFIAPTIRASKVTGELVPYRWVRPPDFDALANANTDTSGGALAEMVRTAHGTHARAGQAFALGDDIPEGERNSTLAKLAGAMRRPGMSEAAILAALLEENEARCRPPLDRAEVERIASSVARYAPDSTPTVAASWTVERSNGNDEPLSGDEWGELGEITSQLPTAPSLPESYIPEALRPWICDAAERTAIPVEYVAAPALVALGAVVGRALGIMPKQYDDWTVVPNLWGGVIGRPGVLKSAAVAEAMRPVRRLAAAASEQHGALAAQAAETHARIELELAALKRSATAKSANVTDIAASMQMLKDEQAAGVVTERRYVTQDATVEKLGELLKQNPRGLLLMRDELAGWWRTLEKPGREGDREFYLEAWNGDGTFTVDRIGRGTLHIPALTLSVLGGIQPAKLHAYQQDAFNGSAGDDGLLQRFQVLVWPDDQGEWRNVDRWPNSEAREQAFAIFERLDALDASGVAMASAYGQSIPALRFSPAAQDLFNAWRDELEQRVRSDELRQTPAFEAHIAKYRSLMPSLALLFHLTDVAAVGSVSFGSSYEGVSLKAARMAAAWCEYLEAHARKLYAPELQPGVLGAHELIGHIKRGAVTDGMTLRDLYRHQWSGLTSQAEVASAIDALSAINMCRIEELAVGAQGGRPSIVLRLHPSLRALVRA